MDSRFERFSRTIDLVGVQGFDALRRARVAVFGLGGVGSHAAVALARSGIGALLLVDHDVVRESNLNRHAVATPRDIGQPKTRVVAEYLGDAAPDTAVQIGELICGSDTTYELLEGPLDFVVDSIDGLNGKVSLLAHCVERELPVVSSMGASARTDPTLLRIGDIETTRGCPLARLVRKRLHRRNIRSGITAVYSTEKKRHALPPDEEDDQTHLCRPRNRLPSLSTLPGIFGYAAAGVVIERIAGLAGPPQDSD